MLKWLQWYEITLVHFYVHRPDRFWCHYGRLQMNAISMEFTVCIATLQYNVYSLQCCNKLRENNLDFTTGS